MGVAKTANVAQFVAQWFQEHQQEVYRWRRHFHQYPELSHEEHATTDFICEVLEAHGLSPQRLPGTGAIVDIDPHPNYSGQRIAFRADIDALPITEHPGELCSLNPGVMHACGHDIHISVALATACALAAAPLKIGVRVIFQPAEEVMDGGAPEVISWGALQGVSHIFAVHAEPKLRTGKIGVRTGAITSAGDVVEIVVKGPGGHSSRPHLTNDVVYGLSKIVTELPMLLSRRVAPSSVTVMVFGMIHAGYAANAIPESGSVSGTIRTGDIAVWRNIQPLLEELIAQILAPTGCGFEIIYTKGVPPVVNDDVATAILADAARSIDPQTVVQAPQSSGGEDFSWYLEHIPGSMARLGCWDGQGDPVDLHQADMRADAHCIGIGVQLFAGITQRFQDEAPVFESEV